MKKEYVIISVIVILVGVIGGAWIIISQIPPKEKKWVYVGSWEGSQTEYNMTTEQFVIVGDEWRIMWACTQKVADSHFEFAVHDAYTGNVAKEIESQGTDQTFFGTSYLNMKGKFYLQIFIRGDLGNWSIYASETT